MEGRRRCTVQFQSLAHTVWQLRNGVPLLRRLQMASSAPNTTKPSETKPKTRLEQQEQLDHYKSWVRLRQDLERARLLCEMIRKREKLKRELIYTKVKLDDMKLFPMRAFFLNVLEEISSRDSREIFHEPVDTDEVNDYLTKIKEPMDLSTMRDKVEQRMYPSLDGLESDFNLMISNCLLYNNKDTIYYKTGLRIRAFGGTLFKKSKKVFQSIGFDNQTGMHLANGPAAILPSPTKHGATSSTKHALTSPTKHVTTSPTKRALTSPAKHASALPTKHVSTTPPKHAATSPTKHPSPLPTKHASASPTKNASTSSTKRAPTSPTKSSPTSTSLISCSESITTTCNCSNSLVCNNNCKKNSGVTTVTPLPLPLIIPASFTTYRTGGDRVESESETEMDVSRTKGIDVDESDTESESSSASTSQSSSASSSDAEEEDDKSGESDVEGGEEFVPPQGNHGGDTVSSSSDSDEDDSSATGEDESPTPAVTSTRSGVVTRNSISHVDPERPIARGLRSMDRNLKTAASKPTSVIRTRTRNSRQGQVESNSDSESSSSSSESEQNEVIKDVKSPPRKRLRTRRERRK